MTIKIALLGASGRMGQMIAAEIAARQDCKIIAAPGRADDKAPAFKNSDVVVDFTAAGFAESHAALSHQYGRALVMGTTGLDAAAEAALKTAAKKAPVLVSANMSLGVNLLAALVEQAAQKLKDDYDIEIFEAHHRHKNDAPSGTALMLAQSAAKGRGIKLDDALIPARHGLIGPRPKGAIGMSVFRGGDVVGDHTVTFAGDAERIELSHKASSRRLFAQGAVMAALWLAKKPAGFYTMKDVLGL